MLLLMAVLASPLVADSLEYDQASGRLSGFDVGIADDPANWESYHDQEEEVWRKSGFIGRIVYTGPKTTFTFTNPGPIATGTPAETRFYFTHELDPSSWREFFLVVRLKGQRHSGARIDFSLKNKVVKNPNGTIELLYGGGEEEVEAGENGYDRDGNPGLCHSSDNYKYKYKYPYKFVWMDVTLIRTTNNSSTLIPNSIYESNISITSTNGTFYTLNLQGVHGDPVGDHSASLSYDPVTGKLIDFNIDEPDDPNYPGGYDNKTAEAWEKSGFIGRVAYTGPPATFTFTNTGPKPDASTGFYFTRLSNTSSWKEYFLVVRSKGITHSGNRIDLYGKNKVVVTSGDSITIDAGAGFEQVENGQFGYRADGSSGTYNGSNGYIYKYRYKYVWMDVTLIRTANSSSLVENSFYESEITVAAGGTSLTLLLNGYYGEPEGTTPGFYSFGVKKTVDDPFPISNLIGRTTPAQGLKVGTVTYSSDNTAANIHFAADSNGTSDDFYFRHEDDTNLKFPYHLVFQATKPIRSLEQVTHDSLFPTESQTVPSPIDYPYRTYTWNYLEGELKIYLPEQINTASGIYTSTVYCFVTTLP
ncbi:MAG: hypothetical protein GX911_06765 [Spirochaetales bacterium]|nr:hypothetical protein [Spirochaetales bacterium]